MRYQLRPGIWVSLVTASSTPGDISLPNDLAAAEGLPDWRAAEFLAGRRVLRQLLADTNREAAAADIAYTERGRPQLVGHPRLGISIGHDGDLIAVGVARGHAIGVDVQHPPAAIRHSMVQRCLRHHSTAVSRLPMAQRTLEFAWVWSVQEACVKAAGTGISGRPWSIDIPPKVRQGRWGEYEWITFRGHSDVPFSCAFAPSPEIVP
jgi:4'-phosphopantetheinyl transferase